MSTFIVKGGKQLSGTYEVSGAKNAGPKLIIAAILSDKDCILHNIPRISDTEKIISAIVGMGGEARWIGEHSVFVNCRNLNNPDVPDIVLSARHVVLFIGATLARLGKLRIARIGGDAIGKRPVDRLMDGLSVLGAKHTKTGRWLQMTLNDKPKGGKYTFSKNTHTGTESLILGSIFIEGKMKLLNAAEEPEIDNLIGMLNLMGANVSRAGKREIVIVGVPKLLGGAEIASIYDRLEAATALAVASLNRGSIEVRNVEQNIVKGFTDVLSRMGIEFSWNDDRVRVVDIPKVLTPTKVVTKIYPGFMTDWQPIILPLLSQAEGKSEVHEMIFEQRWNTLKELNKMGVEYELFKPIEYSELDYNFNTSEYRGDNLYGAYILGPVSFKPANVVSHDIRSGMSVLVTSLFTNGISTISDPDNHIDRGYENIVDKLRDLGADISKK